MNQQLLHDLENLEQILNLGKQEAFRFLNHISDIPTSSTTENLEFQSLKSNGLGAIDAFNLFNERFSNVISSSTGPRYLGYVTGGSTPASVLGDWLTSVYDQNTQATKGHGDLSANIELETIQLLLELFNLPKSFLGGFVTGATMSNFTSLAVARQWLGKELGFDIAKEGLKGQMHILSATPHSSSVKSLAMLGLGSQNLMKIKTIEDREAIDIDDLISEIESLNNQPFILISSAGTVNTVDFDDFEKINVLKQKYNFWWHIDAAFGAFASCSEEYNHLLTSWENADSITIDCHKWLNVPYDSAVFLIQEKHRLHQITTFQNSNAPYLGDPLDNFNYLNFLPENSRRLRALPVWFTLRAYGKEGYRDIVENSISLAKKIGKFIEDSDDFKLLAPIRLNTVCFTLKEFDNSQQVLDFLHQLNQTAKVFMTPTFYKGKQGIRAAFVNWRTTIDDVEMIIDLLQSIVKRKD